MTHLYRRCGAMNFALKALLLFIRNDLAHSSAAMSPSCRGGCGGSLRVPTFLQVDSTEVRRFRKAPLDQNSSVFFLGLQKSGTSSFAHFMGALGWPTIHGGARYFLHNIFPKDWQDCAMPTNGTEFPQYEAFVREMCPDRRDAFAMWLKHHTSFAAADVLWPLLFRFLDEQTEGRAKFVIWRRDPAAWAESYLKFFANYSSPDRFDRLSYGEPRRDLDQEQLAKAYESHSIAVLKYFKEPSRRSRFLDLDFTRPDAGHSLCSFVLANSTTCDQYTKLPNVEPQHLDAKWQSKHSSGLKAEIAQILPEPTSNFECQSQPNL